jgi:hypothetical protein
MYLDNQFGGEMMDADIEVIFDQMHDDMLAMWQINVLSNGGNQDTQLGKPA